ncbi:hypothetical protein COCMIDRAFT_97686 [Bipolaris oryzae ATCC 44560]|uniref:Uncharacterized protein n=1 Tax=Bipolaris oryzae ATCC 44560 TaxID=930090 RepID=W6ZM71_COCMI|nr:uncharacterized protein COCMIDRAFT_97686 [Bipolaris oryzae ATCC 44560]EUC44666.1 hypothetical protein COCMIDRAFT_97686 [Bipolaris oryzae ATCC 44560]
MWPFKTLPSDEAEGKRFDREVKRFSVRLDFWFKILTIILALTSFIFVYTVPSATTRHAMSRIEQDVQQLNYRLNNLNTIVETHGEEIKEHGDKIKEHADEIKEHGDKIKEHADKIKEHADEIKEHGDEIKEHGDEIKEHGEKIQKTSTFEQLYGVAKDVASQDTKLRVLNTKLDELIHTSLNHKKQLEDVAALHSDVQVLEAGLKVLTDGNKGVEAYQKFLSKMQRRHGEL